MTDVKRKIRAVEKTARQKIETAREAVNEGLDSAQDKVSGAVEKASMSAEQVEEVVRRATDAVKDRYDGTVAELRRGYDRLYHELEDVSRRVDRGVRRHPYETAAVTVGVGFLAGFFVGLLVRSSRDRADD